MAHAIELRGVGKRYTKLEERAMLLRSLLPFARPRRSDFWALRDVDLTVAPGETLGMLGRNGAGKSTLLRLLAGVSQPTEGTVTVRGRTAPLLSVGVGFHQEMSGRENVYVNGMLLGLTRTEVAQRFDEIVAFAELHDFIDTPVKFYSSGMFMRLGFSVAVHVAPEILLVDEILAVGDMAFQLKCFDKMRDLMAAGTTIVLVSHSMNAIRLLCPRVVLFRHGQLEFDGASEAAIARHHELLAHDAAVDAGASDDADGATSRRLVTILKRELVGVDGPPMTITHESELAFHVRLRFEQPAESPQLAFNVMNEVGQLAYGRFTAIGTSWRQLRAGEEVDVIVRFRPRLAGGTYRLSTPVYDTACRVMLAADDEGMLFHMPPRLGTLGIADLEATIVIDGEVRSEYDSPLLE